MKKIRAQKISIDIPKEDSEPYAEVVVQTVIKDANYVTTQLIDRSHNTGRFVKHFATQIVTIEDPVTGSIITVSGAGATLIIKAIVGQWLVTDFNGTLNDKLDVIIEE